MEYFKPITMNYATLPYENYVVSNLGNCRRCNSNKNLLKNKDGDFVDRCNRKEIVSDLIFNKIVIEKYYLEDQILLMNKIVKMYFYNEQPIIGDIPYDIKEVILINEISNQHSLKKYDTSKINTPFNLKIFKQFADYRTIKTSIKKLPYGTKADYSNYNTPYGYYKHSYLNQAYQLYI